MNTFCVIPLKWSMTCGETLRNPIGQQINITSPPSRQYFTWKKRWTNKNNTKELKSSHSSCLLPLLLTKYVFFYILIGGQIQEPAFVPCWSVTVELYKSVLPSWTVTFCIFRRVEWCSSDLKSCICGLSVYLFSTCSHRKTFFTVTILLWCPLCHIQQLKWVLMWEYKVLLSVSSKFSGDLQPYFYSFSCHGYLGQGSWLEATINSARSSLWQICLQTDDFRDSLTLTCACLYAHIHVNKFQLKHTEYRTPLIIGWQCNSDHCHLLRHNPNPLWSSICLSPWNRGDVWNQFCLHLRSSQP